MSSPEDHGVADSVRKGLHLCEVYDMVRKRCNTHLVSMWDEHVHSDKDIRRNVRELRKLLMTYKCSIVSTGISLANREPESISQSVCCHRTCDLNQPIDEFCFSCISSYPEFYKGFKSIRSSINTVITRLLTEMVRDVEMPCESDRKL